MGEEQRDCPFYIAFLVHKMYIQRFEAVRLYCSLEIWQLIEFCFLLSPIEVVSPICSQPFHVRQRGAIVPTGLVELVREGCGFKFLGKPFAPFLGYGDCVGFN